MNAGWKGLARPALVSVQGMGAWGALIIVITLGEAVGENMDSGTRRPGLGSQSCHLLAP